MRQTTPELDRLLHQALTDTPDILPGELAAELIRRGWRNEEIGPAFARVAARFRTEAANLFAEAAELQEFQKTRVLRRDPANQNGGGQK